MNELAITPTSPLLQGVTDKDGRSRIGKFDAWLKFNGLFWHNPDLAAYRDSLLTHLAPATVAAHMSSIRGRYTALLGDNRVRDSLMPWRLRTPRPVIKRRWWTNSCSG